jgi:addiction module HigA family antidote
MGGNVKAAAIKVVHPGEILSGDFLIPMGISRYKLAKGTFMHITRISEIIMGDRGITADTALRLAHYFGNAPEFWLNLQNQYDLELKRQELADELKDIRRHE